MSFLPDWEEINERIRFFIDTLEEEVEDIAVDNLEELLNPYNFFGEEFFTDIRDRSFSYRFQCEQELLTIEGGEEEKGVYILYIPDIDKVDAYYDVASLSEFALYSTYIKSGDMLGDTRQLIISTIEEGRKLANM